MSRARPDRPWVGVGIVLFRGDDVLLVRRARPPGAGGWSLPGGAQRLGETAEAAARRELLEETNIVAGDLRLCAHADIVVADAGGRIEYHYTVLEFAGRVPAGEARAGDDADAAVFAPWRGLASRGLTPDTLRVIAAARDLLGIG